MELTVKVEGLERLDKATQAFKNELAREMLIALDASGRKVEAEAKRSIMQGQKTGKLYKRRTVTHQASSPGQAPANDTGRLVNSIASYVVRNGNYALVTAGKGIAKYAAMLEFGTSKMAARPFLFPAAEKSRQWINERMNKAVTNAAIKAAKKGK